MTTGQSCVLLTDAYIASRRRQLLLVVCLPRTFLRATIEETDSCFPFDMFPSCLLTCPRCLSSPFRHPSRFDHPLWPDMTGLPDCKSTRLPNSLPASLPISQGHRLLWITARTVSWRWEARPSSTLQRPLRPSCTLTRTAQKPPRDCWRPPVNRGVMYLLCVVAVACSR